MILNGMKRFPLLDSKARVRLGPKPSVTFSWYGCGGKWKKIKKSMWGTFGTCGNSWEMIRCIGWIRVPWPQKVKHFLPIRWNEDSTVNTWTFRWAFACMSGKQGPRDEYGRTKRFWEKDKPRVWSNMEILFKKIRILIIYCVHSADISNKKIILFIALHWCICLDLRFIWEWIAVSWPCSHWFPFPTYWFQTQISRKTSHGGMHCGNFQI